MKNAITDAGIGGYQLPGQKYLGDVVGGTTAVLGSLGTAAYSGLHDASQPTSSENIAEMIEQAADRNKAENVMTQTADAQMNAEAGKDLDGPSVSITHEEMPPVPTQGRR